MSLLCKEVKTAAFPQAGWRPCASPAKAHPPILMPGTALTGKIRLTAVCFLSALWICGDGLAFPARDAGMADSLNRAGPASWFRDGKGRILNRNDAYSREFVLEDPDLVYVLQTGSAKSGKLPQKDKPADSGGLKSGDEILAESRSAPAYTPLPGQIAIGIQHVTRLAAQLTAIAEGVPSGNQGQASLWFAKLQTVKNEAGKLAATKLQSDLFPQIPVIADFFTAKGDDVPDFVIQTATLLYILPTTIIYSIRKHIAEQNGIITAGNLAHFIKFFSTDGFVSEANWEDKPMPVDSAGIMILDAAATVTQLKTQPWQNAERFLGEETAAQAFARYAAAGDGLAVLKTSFAANSSTVTAKWNELAAWVALQRKHPEQ